MDDFLIINNFPYWCRSIILERLNINSENNYLIQDILSTLSPKKINYLKYIIKQQKNNIPISKILGIKYFYNMVFLNKDVLDPRYDSEIIVDILNDIESYRIFGGQSKMVKDEQSKMVKDEQSKIVKDEQSKMVKDEQSEMVKDEQSEIVKDEQSKMVKDEQSKMVKDEQSEMVKDEQSEMVKNEQSEMVKDEQSEIVKDEQSNIINYKLENKTNGKYINNKILNKNKSLYNILELGGGSGCLSVTALDIIENSHVTIVEKNLNSIKTLKRNIKKNNVIHRTTILQGSWWDPIVKYNNIKFNLLIFNPPYLSLEDMCNQNTINTNEDPLMALYGGIDGLQDYKAVIPLIKKYITDFVIIEICYLKLSSIINILKENQLNDITIYKDLQNNPRMLMVKI